MKSNFKGVNIVDRHEDASGVVLHISKRRIRRRPSLTERDLTQVQSHTEMIAQKWSRVMSEISEYDAQGMLTQCSLPGFTGTHFAYEEEGRLAYASEAFTYKRDIVDLVQAYYSRFGRRAKDDEIKMTIPKGKNTSWPSFIPGSDRVVNDFDIYLTTNMVMIAKKQGIKISELISQIEVASGIPLFFMYGERFQHTGKELPSFVNGRYAGHTKFIEPRVRMINLVSKLMIIYYRAETKKILKYLMSIPNHETDKTILKKEIDWYRNNGYHVLPIDHTKYDHYVAGGKTIPIRSVMRDILVHQYGYSAEFGDQWFKDVMNEMAAPKVYPVFDSTRIYKGAQYLASGESNTSNHGIIGNDFSVIYVVKEFLRRRGTLLSPQNIHDHFSPRKDFFSISWGDDTLLMIHKKFGDEALLLKEIFSIYTMCDHVVKIEPCIKYLGHIYDLYNGTAPFRFVQTTLGPERIKDPYLYRMGLAARYELLDPSIAEFVVKRVVPDLQKDISKGFLKYVESKSSGGRLNGLFTTKSFLQQDGMKGLDINLSDANWRKKAIEDGILRANKVAFGIQEIDSILYLLHHGADADGSELFKDILGVDMEIESEFSLEDVLSLYDDKTPAVSSDVNDKGEYGLSVKQNNVLNSELLIRRLSSLQYKDDKHGFINKVKSYIKTDSIYRNNISFIINLQADLARKYNNL